MTLPQQDAVDDLGRYDPAREPYATGIDPRILNRATGEVERPFGPHGDVSRVAWPPKSRGPLPRDLPPDLTVETANDEIDAWAWEHDDATETLARLRSELSMTSPDGVESVEIQVMKAKAMYRRQARANPTERGRRTSEDITAEVDEALAMDPAYRRKLDLETSIQIALDRLFRARDNVNRLESYVRSLPRAHLGA
jgi:hypothetical protein